MGFVRGLAIVGLQCVHSLDKCVWWKWWKSEGLGVNLCVVDELKSVSGRVDAEGIGDGPW